MCDLNFTKRQQELVYDAVRYYQQNHFGPFKHGGYDSCEDILRKMDHDKYEDK
jgi:hypothetical protein